MRSPLLFHYLTWAVFLLLPGCQSPVSAGPAALEGDDLPRFSLPAGLRHEEERIASEFVRATHRAAACFENAGISVPTSAAVYRVVLFNSAGDARKALAAEFDISVDDLPETFAGTVVDRTLYLVSRNAYRETWHRLYPGWRWQDDSYLELMSHELAHRLHESVAVSLFGTADAMGPVWFFEGLAVVCAGQFERDDNILSQAEIRDFLARKSSRKDAYPLYGQLIRSLLASFTLRDLITGADTPDFPFDLPSEP